MVLKIFGNRIKKYSSILFQNRRRHVPKNDYGEFHAYEDLSEELYETIHEENRDTRVPSLPQTSSMRASSYESVNHRFLPSSLGHTNSVPNERNRQHTVEDATSMRTSTRMENRNYDVIDDSNLMIHHQTIPKLRIHSRRDGQCILRITTEHGEEIQKLMVVLEVPHYLCRVEVDEAELTGYITNELFQSLAGMTIDCLRIRHGMVSGSSQTFSECLHQSNIRFLDISHTEFDDAQFICDAIFIENRQLDRVRICGSGSRWQSFPMLTDKVLHHYATNKLPFDFLINHAETSFTIKGVVHMVKAARKASRANSFNWTFGRILTYTSDTKLALEKVPEVTVMQVHRTQLCVYSVFEPYIRISIFCKIYRRQPSDLEFVNFGGGPAVDV